MAKKKHVHGSMDASNQQAVYEGFIRIGTYVGVFAVGVLIFLALFNS